MAGEVHVIGHPLVQHKLSLLRRKQTSTSEFRSLVAEISMLLAYEVTRDLPTQPVEVETPLTRTTAPVLDGKKIVLISILRAGAGILDGMLRILPSARVGHIGLYRDPRRWRRWSTTSRSPRSCVIATPSWWIPCSPPATPRWRRWSG